MIMFVMDTFSRIRAEAEAHAIKWALKEAAERSEELRLAMIMLNDGYTNEEVVGLYEEKFRLLSREVGTVIVKVEGEPIYPDRKE